MAEPWLTIIGVGEDGPDGLSRASRTALESATLIFGASRHLMLLPETGSKGRVWPIPFADGIGPVLALRGQPVVVLASGDPFWFGAGAVLAAHLEPGEWIAHPGPSCFAWAAARLGWRLEEACCLGLHAAPLPRIRPYLAQGQRLIVTLRDAAAADQLAQLLASLGFGDSSVWVLESLGGPRERLRQTRAGAFACPDVSGTDATGPDITGPVMMAIDVAGAGRAIGLASGLPDDFFEHDGQITKQAIRAMTLAALAPSPGQLLWDIGAGSGSVCIEWLLRHPSMRAIAIEADANRADRIRRNAAALGVDWLQVLHVAAPAGLSGLPPPNAVFIGGGVTEELLTAVWNTMPPGAHLVANVVTLEGEALLAAWSARVGGSLLRIDLAAAQPLGRKRGWRAAMPVVQWRVRK